MNSTNSRHCHCTAWKVFGRKKIAEGRRLWNPQRDESKEPTKRRFGISFWSTKSYSEDQAGWLSNTNGTNVGWTNRIETMDHFRRLAFNPSTFLGSALFEWKSVDSCRCRPIEKCPTRDFFFLSETCQNIRSRCFLMMIADSSISSAGSVLFCFLQLFFGSTTTEKKNWMEDVPQPMTCSSSC